MKKKIYVIISFILILGIITLAIFIPKPSKETEEIQNPKKDEVKEVINNILSYNLDEVIDEEFLRWLYENYGIDTLNNLCNYLKSNEYNYDIWYKLTNKSYLVLQDYYLDKINNVDNIKVINNNSSDITLGFIGDVSLADNYKIMPEYEKRNQGALGILSANVLDILKNVDVMVANNEFTVSNRGTPIPKKMYTFRAKPENLKVYAEMGVDLVTLANNHVYDYGEDAFDDMLMYLDSYAIPHIGAGQNIKEAAKPYYFIINGKKIAFVNATRAEKNILTPGATETSKGVLRCYDPTYFLNTIKAAKENSDYVIALVHWGKENYHTLEDVQIKTGKMYLDAGADVIVGTHAHALQGLEFYENKLIAYNLGDFIFNAKDEDTGILKVKIDKNGNFSYYFDACIQKNSYTDLAYNEDKNRILKNMESYSVNALINEDGQIKIK